MRALDHSGLPPRLHFYDLMPSRDDLVREVVEGLSRTPKSINTKFFYDDAGVQLFERITQLPEYYLARAERDILRQYLPAIAARIGKDLVLLEPGSGNCEKAALLMDALKPRAYVCWDIAINTLYRTSARLARQFPWLDCYALGTDYNSGLPLPPHLPDGKRVAFFPGSSIGNFEAPAALALLQRLWDLAGAGGGLLIGVDMPKSADVLQHAYNDRQSVTAAFNKNCLRHINALTGAHFSNEAFTHCAIYNEGAQRMELSLQSRYAHEVDIAGTTIHFRAGERIHTEYAYQYSTRSFASLAARAGFRRDKTWYDRKRQFSIHYLVADPNTVAMDFDPAAQENFLPRKMPAMDEGPYDLPERRH